MRISERQFIERLRHEALRRSAAPHGTFALRHGIGDDCAILSCSPRKDLLVTTDLFLEGVHFQREWQQPSLLGRKALARGLSDIAAMGGLPRFAFLSLAIPLRTPDRWINAFLRGMLQLAKESGVTLAGGDTGSSQSGVVSDIIVLGEVPRGTGILRSGARPGDEIWVTGKLGGAALALRLLRGRKRIPHRATTLRPLLSPQPRLRMGSYLRERRLASAMIDLSDGLSIDLSRLCQASGVGARIDEAALPRAPQTPIELALHGGEDHELLFTVSPARTHHLPGRIAGVRLTRIGTVQRGRALRLVRGGRERPLPVLGFEHF
jgi:thiamine-monophosphate kinase